MKSVADKMLKEQDRRNRTSKGRRDPPPESGDETVVVMRFIITGGKDLNTISFDNSPSNPGRKEKKYVDPGTMSVRLMLLQRNAKPGLRPGAEQPVIAKLARNADGWVDDESLKNIDM